MVYKDKLCALTLCCRVSMDIDDFVEHCEHQSEVQSKNYAECFALFNRGMIYACHQLMLKNIDNSVDLGPKQSKLYDAVKREHTLVFTKSEKIKTSDRWTENTVSEKGKGSDDAVKIYQDSENSSTFMIDLCLDAGPVQAIALASRLEFADSWMNAISTSTFVRQLSAHSHIVCLTVKNPIWTYFGDNKVYVRIDTFDNVLFDKVFLVVVTPLSTSECRRYRVGACSYSANARFFAFTSLTFFFAGMSGTPAMLSNTTVKIYVENMKIVQYTPMYINNLACVDCFSKVCRLWANTARQLGDMLYEGETLSKLALFLEKRDHEQYCI